ncbi:cobyric acid synthase [Halopenitus sp. H-Gu1]|uniref:cobyric acid synthase n=1 Tax=Halopenitus sp. H-Gu1 TaxID=3242697 RepID=UPI00359CC6BD
MKRSTPTILVAGTASHVGKSTVATGLCRLLADRGLDVAPFKAQNMSNNARAVPIARGGGDSGHDGDGGHDEDDGTGENDEHGEDGTPDAFGEIGISQYVQARAACTPPTTDHNPVLLKPRGEGESQLVIDGEAIDHVPASKYYEERWEDAREAAVGAYHRLASDADIVIAEGAGSIAEINLHDRDLANVETARFADAEILLVADIERGGVFASLVGTLELLPDDLRRRVAGAVITKFRGDPTLLEPGIDAVAERTGVPILGVIPYSDPGLPAEDSVGLPAAEATTGGSAIRGKDDVPEERTVTIAVPRLPTISNFTDLEPLAFEPGVRVAYLPISDSAATSDDDDSGNVSDRLREADAVVIPGTKNTVDDLIALRRSGFGSALSSFEGPIVGLCGGYQLLGERIRNADIEGTGETSTVTGLGLLPVETTFSTRKRVVSTELDLRGSGPLSGVDASVRGYEIHMGETRLAGSSSQGRPVRFPFSPVEDVTSASDESRSVAEESREHAAFGVSIGGPTGVLGTYLHGLFENRVVRETFVQNVRATAGQSRPQIDLEDPSPYDAAADLLRDHVDLGALSVPE